MITVSHCLWQFCAYFCLKIIWQYRKTVNENSIEIVCFKSWVDFGRHRACVNRQIELIQSTHLIAKHDQLLIAVSLSCVSRHHNGARSHQIIVEDSKFTSHRNNNKTKWNHNYRLMCTDPSRIRSDKAEQEREKTTHSVAGNRPSVRYTWFLWTHTLMVCRLFMCFELSISRSHSAGFVGISNRISRIFQAVLFRAHLLFTLLFYFLWFQFVMMCLSCTQAHKHKTARCLHFNGLCLHLTHTERCRSCSVQHHNWFDVFFFLNIMSVFFSLCVSM